MRTDGLIRRVDTMVCEPPTTSSEQRGPEFSSQKNLICLLTKLKLKVNPCLFGSPHPCSLNTRHHPPIPCFHRPRPSTEAGALVRDAATIQKQADKVGV